jgi:transaldolase
MNQLDALKQYTTVVADTGDFLELVSLGAQDATTNPSLILKSVMKPQYQALLEDNKKRFSHESLALRMDRLIVRFGCEILAHVPGRVSTEIDARLSFNQEACVERARQIMSLYAQEGIAPERVLIKIASTWEGMQAARVLQKEGINCNLTLLFSLAQAQVCADAGVKLISPFVGRIYDWHKKSLGSQWKEEDHSGALDPGVQSVRTIYEYYKKLGITTEVMGASFRNTGQIMALAGCDLLTISPELLSSLKSTELDPAFKPALSVSSARDTNHTRVHLSESEFRLNMNDDAMASDKLAEGIRAFCADTVKLEGLMQ